jgi:RHS repeat-associated protein
VSRGGAAYLGKDILGSVRSTTNEYGALEDRYEYDAFGKPYKGDLTTGMNLGYTGKPYDTATGLYNYGFRDYQPEVARFTTVDPIRDGANWFAYVNNDPVNWVDPWGLECTPSDKKDTQRPVTPIAQNDPLLSGIPKMSEYGCVFRTYQGVAENYTGLNLTAGEIVESVKTLQSTPNIANPTQMVVDKEMKVNNPDQVINNAFEILGQSGTTATVNWGAEKEQTPDYYRQVGTTPLGNEHSVLLDSNKNLITDPYDPNIPLTDTQAMPVYIHEPKKE